MRIIHWLTVVAILTAFGSAVAQEPDSDESSGLPPVHYPALVQYAASPEGFAPKGWAIEKKIEGDLNDDGVPDFVLVLHQKSPRNIIKNPEGMGSAEFDSNPRMLAVVFADQKSGGYTLMACNHELIPRWDAPNITDPFDGIKIVNRTIHINLQSWSSAGSWFASKITFTFRYQHGSINLIGYDSFNYHRASGAYTRASVNYLTKKAEIINGVENDTEKKINKVIWEALPAHCPMPSLQQIGNGFEFQPPIQLADTDPFATNNNDHP